MTTKTARDPNGEPIVGRSRSPDSWKGASAMSPLVNCPRC